MLASHGDKLQERGERDLDFRLYHIGVCSRRAERGCGPRGVGFDSTKWSFRVMEMLVGGCCDTRVLGQGRGLGIGLVGINDVYWYDYYHF